MADEGGVAAVDRALSILDAFCESDAKLSLAEISKRTGLYKSTILRLMKSLEKFGYMYRSDDGAYTLGAKTLFLGTLYQRQFRTSEIVPPVLRKIVAELKEGDETVLLMKPLTFMNLSGRALRAAVDFYKLPGS